MILATHLNGFPSKRFSHMVLTLGTFDGIHLGHQKVLGSVLREAQKRKGTAAVLTFQEHPQTVIHPKRGTSILTSVWHKMSLIDRLKIDLCLALHFNRSISELRPEMFVKKILRDKLQVEKVILGHDSRFGHNRQGGIEEMSYLAKKYDFAFSVIPPVRKDGFTISSTIIRQLIGEGDFKMVANLLGRPYSIVGTVISGSGRGTKLGFPTANLNPHGEVLPPGGVYVVRVRLVEFEKVSTGNDFFRFNEAGKERFFRAVMNLGTRPTFDLSSHQKHSLIPEVHLLDYHGKLYGKVMEIEFLTKLRDEKKFTEVISLQKQIVRDVKNAGRYFSTFTKI